MKKVIVAVIGLLCFTPTAFAYNWGVGLHGGVSQNDPDYIGIVDKLVSKNYGVFGIEGFYERNASFELSDGEEFLGIKIGIDLYGKNKLKLPSVQATENTYAIPLTIYYKNNLESENISSFIGIGLTQINSEVKISGAENISKTKIFPHIAVGAEYRLNWLVALGVEIKYNFDAEVKKNGNVLSDRSGIGGAVTARFYF